MMNVLVNRIEFEAWCLGRVLNPMKNGGISRFAKATYLIFLLIWAVVVLDPASAEPHPWLLVSLTAILFTILGKMWRIEAEYWLSRLNPVSLELNFGDDEQ